ncbi:defensin beta 118-like [Peromyscus eremicus]|uniref:defensin beta 118-like n=1 Tax=Peromyscus eremicus TaxID=42410 RepID=UPI0027DB0F64|nr:defensin beta 118-like [Peromyscus eremicus]
MFWTLGCVTSFSKIMKYSLLTLMVFFILFQLFPVCRCRKACWVIRGHCRKYCKSGEQLKKPCSNGDYCCTASKMDALPPAPIKPFSLNSKEHSQARPVIVSTDNNELGLS